MNCLFRSNTFTTAPSAIMNCPLEFVAILCGSLSLWLSSPSLPNDHSGRKQCSVPRLQRVLLILPSYSGSTFADLVPTVGHSQKESPLPTTCVTSKKTRFTWQTLEMIFLRSILLDKAIGSALMPFLSWIWKLFCTAARQFSSLIHTLHGAIASTGLSTVCNIVAMTRFFIAKMRSDVFRASFLKALVACLHLSHVVSKSKYFSADCLNRYLAALTFGPCLIKHFI